MKIVILKSAVILLSLASCLIASKLFLSDRLGKNQLSGMMNAYTYANGTNATAGGKNATGKNGTAGNGTGSAAPAVAGKSGGAPAGPAAPGTGVYVGKPNSSNALGLVGPLNYSISQPPYTVKSCDQVLLIPGQRVLDFDDYCKKQEGFFTMSIYMINLFEARDSNKLVESITMDRLKRTPTHLIGSPGCIDFQGIDKRIAVCVKTKEMVDELIQAYMAFHRCRAGDNLKQLDWDKVKKILLACSMGKKIDLTGVFPKGALATITANANNSTANGSVDAKKSKKNLPSLAGNDTKPDINPYYVDMKVPGS